LAGTGPFGFSFFFFASTPPPTLFLPVTAPRKLGPPPRVGQQRARTQPIRGPLPLLFLFLFLSTVNSGRPRVRVSPPPPLWGMYDTGPPPVESGVPPPRVVFVTSPGVGTGPTFTHLPGAKPCLAQGKNRREFSELAPGPKKFLFFCPQSGKSQPVGPPGPPKCLTRKLRNPIRPAPPHGASTGIPPIWVWGWFGAPGKDGLVPPTKAPFT